MTTCPTCHTRLPPPLPPRDCPVYHDWAVSAEGIPTCCRCGEECRAFQWVGQRLDGCDNCGQHIGYHDGLHRLKRGSPFSAESEWELDPWQEGGRWHGWRERHLPVTRTTEQVGSVDNEC